MKKKSKTMPVKDYTAESLIFQVLVKNLSDIPILFTTAKTLDFTKKYQIITEFDPDRGVAYVSGDFSNRTKENTKEILSMCASLLLNTANIEGSVVEES